MDSNLTDQQNFGAETQLSEPHFDEEATLLSARRVVPLHEFTAETRSRKRFAFGLAIALGLLVGVLGATLIIQRGEKEQASVVETTASVSPQAAPETKSLTEESGAKPDPSGSTAGENRGGVTTQEVNEEGASNQAGQQGPQEMPGATSTEMTEATQNEVIQLRDKREMRRAERAATRLRNKAERTARRDSRDRKGQTSDDLLRIREIFEGVPRP